jgi:hypothetical protein
MSQSLQTKRRSGVPNYLTTDIAAILEDCVNAYADAVDDEGYRDDAAFDAAE